MFNSKLKKIKDQIELKVRTKEKKKYNEFIEENKRTYQQIIKEKDKRFEDSNNEWRETTDNLKLNFQKKIDKQKEYYENKIKELDKKREEEKEEIIKQKDIKFENLKEIKNQQLEEKNKRIKEIKRAAEKYIQEETKKIENIKAELLRKTEFLNNSFIEQMKIMAETKDISNKVITSVAKHDSALTNLSQNLLIATNVQHELSNYSKKIIKSLEQLSDQSLKFEKKADKNLIDINIKQTIEEG